MFLVTGFEREVAVLETGVAGERDGWNLPAFFPWKRADFANQGVAVFVGHADVADQDIESRAFERPQGFGGRRDGGYLQIELREQNGEHLARIVVVFDQ